jgi:hypothetical protein
MVSSKSAQALHWKDHWAKISLIYRAKIRAARFDSEPELFYSLVNTPKDSIIVYDTDDDQNGIGKKHDGKNKSGLLYMVLRERYLNTFEKDKKTVFDPKNLDHVQHMVAWLKGRDAGTGFFSSW